LVGCVGWGVGVLETHCNHFTHASFVIPLPGRLESHQIKKDSEWYNFIKELDRQRARGVQVGADGGGGRRSKGRGRWRPGQEFCLVCCSRPSA
jgi:hypothetical protein